MDTFSGTFVTTLSNFYPVSDLDEEVSAYLLRNRSLWLVEHETATEDLSSAYSFFMSVIITVFGTVLSILTAGGNLMVIISIKMDKQLQTISNYFLFSLAIADLTVGCVSIPLMTLYTVQGRWSLGYVACQFWLNIDYLMSNSSVMNLLLISFDRYLSVTRPLTYRPRRTKKKAIIMMSLTFVVSLLLWSPWIIAWPHIESQFTIPSDMCIIQFLVTNPYVTLGTACAAFYIPVSVMVFLYTRVYFTTQKRQHEFLKMQGIRKMSHFFTASQRQRKLNKNAVFQQNCEQPLAASKSRLTSDSAANSKPLVANGGTTPTGCSPSTAKGDAFTRTKNDSDSQVASSASSKTPSTAKKRSWSPEQDAKSKRVLFDPEFNRSISGTSMNHLRIRSDGDNGNGDGSLRNCCILQNSDSSFPKVAFGYSKPSHLFGDDHNVVSRTEPPYGSKPAECLARDSDNDDDVDDDHGPPSSGYPSFSNALRSEALSQGCDVDSESDLEVMTTKRSQLSAGLTNLLASAFAMTFSNRLATLSNCPSQKSPPLSSKPSGDSSTRFNFGRKKTEGKAAKTLSAILLAFIITWTPYNLIVCIEAFMPNTVPLPWFTFSYYLCYLNSTVNPLCYALCSPYFRQTFVRILTCKWRKRQYRVIQLMPGFQNR